MSEMEYKLSKVVGMEDLKATLQDYLRDAMADSLRRDLGLAPGLKRPVMIFSENAGTGKTSIATLVPGITCCNCKIVKFSAQQIS